MASKVVKVVCLCGARFPDERVTVGMTRVDSKVCPKCKRRVRIEVKNERVHVTAE